MRTVRVGKRLVGEGQPCFLAAEVGINHNGDLELAHRSIDAAAEAGADAVKFQNYRTEDFLSDRSLTHEYVSQGKTVVESQYDMFKRCELAPDKLRELREHCDRRGVVFFSTPSSEKGIEELVEIGVPVLKNGSDYLGNLPLIRGMARTGLPTVISGGMATFAEVQDAVSAFREAGGKNLILLHCTSSYPTRPEDVHLRKMAALSAAFDCAVGLSDHTEGNVAAIGAVALGACMIEKHFTLDKNLPGPDHWFSADPAEFRALVESVRSVEKSLGSAELRPAASEELGRRDNRLSCVAARELPSGHRLLASDIAFRRPGFGFPPKEVESLVARELVRPITPGHVFADEDFAE
jgi:N,N'-diacetyllegionaminate synthase